MKCSPGSLGLPAPLPALPVKVVYGSKKCQDLFCPKLLSAGRGNLLRQLLQCCTIGCHVAGAAAHISDLLLQALAVKAPPGHAQAWSSRLPLHLWLASVRPKLLISLKILTLRSHLQKSFPMDLNVIGPGYQLWKCQAKGSAGADAHRSRNDPCWSSNTTKQRLYFTAHEVHVGIQAVDQTAA
eukprot:CAMPEP_0181433838 /NCGR_PEP_ID=MMETSP1110-20121109/19507_1 /TAXON_ID=174948 /ORGANISM="Symbiodinium sp., Strain CCMP421" /LENGTH=182 /DNA_ID=CAMNT_0023557321 /DNA_START=287 /DNA_END=838 /DNA_ORIENTATION=+